MITYICGSDIKYSEFPKAFWEDLEKCMERGDEILLGDSDFAHRVYGRCKNKQYENVQKKKSVCLLQSACLSNAIRCLLYGTGRVQKSIF